MLNSSSIILYLVIAFLFTGIGDNFKISFPNNTFSSLKPHYICKLIKQSFNQTSKSLVSFTKGKISCLTILISVISRSLSLAINPTCDKRFISKIMNRRWNSCFIYLVPDVDDNSR